MFAFAAGDIPPKLHGAPGRATNKLILRYSVRDEILCDLMPVARYH